MHCKPLGYRKDAIFQKTYYFYSLPNGEIVQALPNGHSSEVASFLYSGTHEKAVSRKKIKIVNELFRACEAAGEVPEELLFSKKGLWVDYPNRLKRAPRYVLYKPGQTLGQRTTELLLNFNRVGNNARN